MLFGGITIGYQLDSILFKGLNLQLYFYILSFLIGSLLLSLVIKISKNTGRTLAKYGRQGELKRMDTNVFVDQGIYKYMRHPMHLGLLFFPLSIAFISGSLSFIIIISPLEAFLILIMVKFIEEPEAIKKFGKDYLIYKSKVPGFCFSIKCLKKLFKVVSIKTIK